MAHPKDATAGHVGGPAPKMKIRLKDLPEMNYLTNENPPKGEVQLLSTCNFRGYFKNPEKTKEVFDGEGWINTGDVGIIQQNGSLKIVDRVKNIFKLAQGEYIAPEKLEAVYV